ILNHKATTTTIWMRVNGWTGVWVAGSGELKAGLKHALVLRRRMELEGGRVAGQFDGNAVVGLDRETAGSEAAEPGNMHLLGRQRNVVIAGLLDDGGANVVFRTRAIG